MKHSIQTTDQTPQPPSPKIFSLLPLALAGLTVFGFVSCNGKKEPQADITTAETVKAQAQVNDYATNNSEEQKKKVEVAFAALDQEIKELELRVEATSGENKAEAQYKLEELKKRRGEIQADYTEAKFNALVEDIKNAVR
jgi:hypothetical protein